MKLSSSFADFSLAELFQVIEQGRKTGRLSLYTYENRHSPGSMSNHFYIWFEQGYLVAAANRLNGRDLISKITQRGWANLQVIDQIFTETSTSKSLGWQLKTQGVLSNEQLNLLFASQLQQVQELFEIKEGIFKLDTKAVSPLREMTGLSLRATEVAFMALRELKNWEILADVLPEMTSGIQSLIQDEPRMQFNIFEWQVWKFANGSFSLSAIASQLNQPITLVQQAAFRLIIAGLVEEVPVVKSTPEPNNDLRNRNLTNSFGGSQVKQSKQPETPKVSTSFLQNLVGFLTRSKA
ncbi:DUF4388 domain-containing protein [Mastigocladopsis repens]|uniref:DUF4388 domain-containing protein n=1 Tax=Mastigocladopsis repens TaxID=221287 RepID=UPI0002D651D7|nr:DUF4388 domain-containing protein [Mastigocladopsis repens]